MLTQAELKLHLHYCPESGIFTRLQSKTRVELIGMPTGAIDKLGYVIIYITGKVYKAHRLAWIYIHGAHPENLIDHINGNRSDNRISNLRQATTSQNLYNKRMYSTNSSQVKGVHWYSRNQNGVEQ